MKSYTHDLYLIERTKLLEGILCQSIIFTNALGKQWGGGDVNNPINALSQFTDERTTLHTPISNTELELIKNEIRQIYKSPLVLNSQLSILAPTAFAQYFVSKSDISYTLKSSSSVTIINGADTYQDITEEINIDVKSNLSISYHLVFSYKDLVTNDTYTDYYDFTYYIAGVENRYPTKPWTITSCINRVLDLCQPIYEGEKPKYTLNPVQAKKWENELAPEFTMTQCTLREQLKIIGGYIHAEPRLGGYDENGVYQENWIFFDEYGQVAEANIGDTPYVYKGKSQDINQFCTDITTNAQNLVNSLDYAQGVIIDPDLNNCKTVRTDNINVKLTDTDAIVITQMPIYKIIDVKCGVYNPDYKGEEGTNLYVIPPVSIKQFIYEAYEYNNLESYKGAYPYVKAYGIYYTQGEKEIRGLSFRAQTDSGTEWEEFWNTPAIVNILKEAIRNSDTTEAIKNSLISMVESNWTTGFSYFAFQVTYMPIYEAKFSHGKQLIIPNATQFTQIYNQGENLVENRYYGENMKGVAQRLGNVEEVRTYILKDKDISKIPKTGQSLDGYIISAVTCQYMPFYVKCTVALTKDFNRISQYVGINSNKRLAEVSERQAYKRDILIKEYAILGDKKESQLNNAVIFNNNRVKNDILGIFDTSKLERTNKPVSRAEIRGYTKSGTPLTPVKLPVVSSAFGNSMVFNFGFKDNYSAGEAIQKIDSAFWQTDVSYCDYYGRMYYMDFILDDIASPYLASSEGMTVKMNTTSNGTALYNDKKYIIRKDSREIPNLNIELEFVTNRKDLNIGSSLASNCHFVCGDRGEQKIKVYFFNEPINKFANTLDLSKAIILPDETQEITVDVENSFVGFDILPTIEFQSWAICTPSAKESTVYEDEDGNVETVEVQKGGEVLISCNNGSAYYRDKGKFQETIFLTLTRNIYK